MLVGEGRAGSGNQASGRQGQRKGQGSTGHGSINIPEGAGTRNLSLRGPGAVARAHPRIEEGGHGGEPIRRILAAGALHDLGHTAGTPARARKTAAARPMVKSVVRSSMRAPRANSSGAMKRVEPNMRPMSNGPGW